MSMTETVTSTYALSYTLLMSSGANAADTWIALWVAVFGLAAFIIGTLFIARWVPLR